MDKAKLIPGFRFHPTDVELVKYFLTRKVMGKKFFQVIAELDIYQYSPWDLPDKSCLRTGDLDWYFFCPRGKKYGSGSRTNRSTENGYWKATGKDRAVRHDKQTVGMIKTLVFHFGKAPDGNRTDWVMHEYRLEDKDLTSKGIAQDSYVICKVFQKQGPGPRNGAQYGRPFNEEDWDDDEEGEIPSAALSAQVPILTMTSNSSPQTEQHLPASGSIEATSMSCLSGPVPSPSEPANPSDSSNQAVNNDDDIPTMPDLSKEGNKTPEKVDNHGQENIAEPSSDIFEGLGDLDNWVTLDDFFSGENAGDVVGFDDLEYVGLSDLGSP